MASDEKNNPEQLPIMLKELLNLEGYDSLKDAVEQTAQKIRKMKEEEDEKQKDEN
jgi:hypothetical protein